MSQHLNEPIALSPVTTNWQRLMEIAAIANFGIFCTLLAAAVITGAGELATGDTLTTSASWLWWGSLVLSPLLAYVGADFGAGLVHCLADNFGSEDTPFFGKAFIKPFRDHHSNPQDIVHHDFVEANGNNCLVGLMQIVPVFALVVGLPSPATILLGAFVFFFAVATVLTNQIHKWAHMARPPRTVLQMQSLGLVLAPKDHAVHHTAPHNSYYCITNGWLNPIIERFGLFSKLISRDPPPLLQPPLNGRSASR